MAFAKIILNGDVLMDVTSDTVAADKLLSTYTATKNDGTKISGSYVPPNPVISSLTVTPTESAQTFNAAAVSGYKPVTVNAIASDYIGSAIPLKSSGNLWANGSEVIVPYGYYSEEAQYTFPKASINAYANVVSSTGKIVYGYSISQNKEGYAFGGFSTETPLPTQAAQTITPTSTVQYINSYQWLTGSQTIAAIPSTYVGSGVPRPSGNDVTWTVGNFTSYGQSAKTTVTGTFNTSGYVSSGSSYSNTIYIPAANGTTYTPSALSRTLVASGKYTLGDIVVEAIPSAYIIPSGTSNITSNGTYDIASYASVSVSCAGGEYYDVYKRMALMSALSYQVSEVQDFCNSLSIIWGGQFAGRRFFSYLSGSIVFENVTDIRSNAFASPWSGAWTGYSDYWYYFPSAQYVSEMAFYGCPCLTSIDLPLVSIIRPYTFAHCGNMSLVNLPSCEAVQASAFERCSKLTTISLSKCAYISEYAFISCSILSKVSVPSCSYISPSAFAYCSNLTEVYAPACKSISTYAFYQCFKLGTASFSQCLSIGTRAFASCTSLSTISFPECTDIGANAFMTCPNIESAVFPKATSIGGYAFSGCTNLTTIDFPACSVVSAWAFTSCSNLTSVSLPTCGIISQGVFNSCINLSVISLPMCSTISTGAFSYCYHLLSVYLLGSSVVSLINANAFNITPISNTTTSTGGVYGSIYVPSSLYDTYVSATNWKTYSSRFVSV